MKPKSTILLESRVDVLLILQLFLFSDQMLFLLLLFYFSGAICVITGSLYAQKKDAGMVMAVNTKSRSGRKRKRSEAESRRE